MPHLHDIRGEIRAGHNQVRLRYARKLRELTGRNIILYYSGWLQKPTAPGGEINDLDMGAFMSVIHGLDRERGLDLILHTPGGNVAATEALVNYLRAMFGTDIRAIVPQLAMSAGTMIACAAKSVLMGKHSFLGPIDPQFRGIPANEIVREFNRASREIKKDPAKIHVWRPIIAQYTPTLLGQCENGTRWSNEMAKEWLETGMLKKQRGAKQKAATIVNKLADTAKTKSHDRHFTAEYCSRIGMVVESMEESQKLQDTVLSLHHSCMLTLMETPASKIIENHEGTGAMLAVDT